MKKIILYVKTHNKTGLKYFGKYEGKNVFNYKGSGKYWRNHLDMHGNDVSTEIVGVFEDANAAKEFALAFSTENNIVESKEWANLKVECLDGGWDYVNSTGKNGFYKLTEEKRQELATKGGHACFAAGKGIHSMTPEQKKQGLYKNGVHIQHLEETRENTLKTNNKKYNVDYPTQNTEVKAKIKKTMFEKYGVDNPMKIESVKERHRENLTKKYGVDNISKHENVKAKKKKKFEEKYGVSCALNTEEAKEKARQAQLKKRSREIVKKLEELRDTFGIKLPRNYPLMSDEKLLLAYNEYIKQIQT